MDGDSRTTRARGDQLLCVCKNRGIMKSVTAARDREAMPILIREGSNQDGWYVCREGDNERRQMIV